MRVLGRSLFGIILLIAAVANGAPQPCPPGGNCAGVSIGVPSASVAPGETVGASLRVQQGQNDQQPGGVDEIAAVNVSIGIAGLDLADCSAPGVDGLNPSFFLLPAASGHSRVIVQNLTCAHRASCLCPSSGETRDDYVNILLVGDTSAAGVAPLPSGDLLYIALRVPADAGSGAVPLHVFSALDDAALLPRPPGAAWLSVADGRAIDQTLGAGGATFNVRIGDGSVNVGSAITPSETPDATATATPIATSTATATAPATLTPTETASATAPLPTETSTVAPTVVPPTAIDTPTLAVPTLTVTPPLTATATATVSQPACIGDCDHSGDVAISEIIIGVNIVLGGAPSSACSALDCLPGGGVDVSCLITAVNAALNGCPE